MRSPLVRPRPSRSPPPEATPAASSRAMRSLRPYSRTICARESSRSDVSSSVVAGLCSGRCDRADMASSRGARSFRQASTSLASFFDRPTPSDGGSIPANDTCMPLPMVLTAGSGGIRILVPASPVPCRRASPMRRTPLGNCVRPLPDTSASLPCLGSDKLLRPIPSKVGGDASAWEGLSLPPPPSRFRAATALLTAAVTVSSAVREGMLSVASLGGSTPPSSAPTASASTAAAATAAAAAAATAASAALASSPPEMPLPPLPPPSVKAPDPSVLRPAVMPKLGRSRLPSLGGAMASVDGGRGKSASCASEGEPVCLAPLLLFECNDPSRNRPAPPELSPDPAETPRLSWCCSSPAARSNRSQAVS